MRDLMYRVLEVRTFDGGFAALEHDSPDFLTRIKHLPLGGDEKLDASYIRCVSYAKQSFRDKVL